MFNFKKVIIINGNRYDILTETITNVQQLFATINDINSMIVLVIAHGTDEYNIDLSKLILNRGDFANLSIDAIVSQLTPELIYSFATTAFKQLKPIRSFTSNDLLGEVVVSPYNIQIDELSNTEYDPAYPDMVISCSEYDLTKVIPVIDGKLRKCGWGGKKIYIENRVALVKYCDIVTFISFGEADIELIALSDIINTTADETKSYLLVLDGKLFYDDSIFDSKPVFKLNQKFVVDLFPDFTSFDDIIQNDDSFVIQINKPRILIRDVHMSLIYSNMGTSVYKFFEKDTQNNHVDYLCIDKNDSSVHGITITDDLYKDPLNPLDQFEHHVYVHNVSTNMKLIQLTLH